MNNATYLNKTECRGGTVNHNPKPTPYAQKLHTLHTLEPSSIKSVVSTWDMV